MSEPRLPRSTLREEERGRHKDRFIRGVREGVERRAEEWYGVMEGRK